MKYIEGYYNLIHKKDRRLDRLMYYYPERDAFGDAYSLVWTSKDAEKIYFIEPVKRHKVTNKPIITPKQALNFFHHKLEYIFE